MNSYYLKGIPIDPLPTAQGIPPSDGRLNHWTNGIMAGWWWFTMNIKTKKHEQQTWNQKWICLLWVARWNWWNDTTGVVSISVSGQGMISNDSKRDGNWEVQINSMSTLPFGYRINIDQSSWFSLKYILSPLRHDYWPHKTQVIVDHHRDCGSGIAPPSTPKRTLGPVTRTENHDIARNDGFFLTIMIPNMAVYSTMMFVHQCWFSAIKHHQAVWKKGGFPIGIPKPLPFPLRSAIGFSNQRLPGAPPELPCRGGRGGEKQRLCSSVESPWVLIYFSGSITGWLCTRGLSRWKRL